MPAAAIAIVVAIVWLGFLNIVKIGMIDTHFTRSPETHGFIVSPWIVQGGSTEPTRTAELPTTFHTVRYTQTRAADGYVETVRYDADIRWGAASLAYLMIAGPLVIAGLLIRQWLIASHE